jgi:hypothetical protein
MMMCGSSGATPAQPAPLEHVAVYLSPLPLVGAAPDGIVQVTGMACATPFQPQASADAESNCTVYVFVSAPSFFDQLTVSPGHACTVSGSTDSALLTTAAVTGCGVEPPSQVPYECLGRQETCSAIAPTRIMLIAADNRIVRDTL